MQNPLQIFVVPYATDAAASISDGWPPCALSTVSVEDVIVVSQSLLVASFHEHAKMFIMRRNN